MRREFWVTIFIVAFLFTPVFVSAGVIINEICPTGCASSDHQWVEIFNPDASAIDLTGWKFWENSTRHGLAVSSSSLKQSFSLEPNEYAVITQDDEMFCADHPGFSSAIFDSVWGTLKDDGEEIGLKDNSDNFIEQFTYKAITNFSLQRKDVAVSVSDVDNWCEHESGNTVGAVNVCPVVVETPTTTPPVETPTTTPTTTALAVTPPLKINEFVPNPSSGEEWIEIYNLATSSVVIDGLKIFDAVGEIATPTGTIEAGGFFVVELTSSKLNNTGGDSVILKDASDAVIDSTSYISVSEGDSIARSVDGAGSFAETTSLTRNAANVITAPVVVVPSNGGGGGGGGSSNNYVAPIVVSIPEIVINELVSDPTDGAVEFVELYNKSNASVSLAGWWIEDGSGSRNVLNESIAPLGFFVLEKPSGSLNNAGDIVRLMSADGKEMDKVSYGNWNDGSASNNAVFASDPFSLARKTDGYDTNNDHSNFVVTAQITKGGPNVILSVTQFSSTTTTSTSIQNLEEKEENTLPMISILLPEEIIVGESVEFDASETIDLEEDELSFAWDFGDGSHAYGETVLHEYKEEGTFTITLVVKDGVGQSKETAKVKVAVSQLLSNSVISNEVSGAAATRLRSESVGTSARQGGSYLGLVGLDKMSEVGTGDRVKVSGTVAVLPNIFGSQYFYIASGLNGVQIYMNSKKFPQLRVGDVVEVTGEISEPYGEKRVKVKNTTDIKVLKNQGEPIPAELTTIDLSESVGALVKIKGEVTEMKSTYLFIDDGEGEVKVAFKRGANITKGGLQIGDLVEIIGIVGQSSSGIQLLPRKMVDIVKTGHIEKDLLAGAAQADKDKTTETYLTATAGGLTSILISLAAKARGKVAVGLLKRVGGLAMLVVRRKTKV